MENVYVYVYVCIAFHYAPTVLAGLNVFPNYANKDVFCWISLVLFHITFTTQPEKQQSALIENSGHFLLNKSGLSIYNPGPHLGLDALMQLAFCVDFKSF